MNEAIKQAIDTLKVARDAFEAWGNGTTKIERAIGALVIEDAALSRLRDTQRVLVEALRELVALEADGRQADEAAIEAWERARAALASVEQQQEQPFHTTPDGDEEVTARLPLTCWGLSSFCAETGHKCRASGACVYAPPAIAAAAKGQSHG